MSEEEKANVKCIVSDMYCVYYDLLRKHFPNALYIIDKFHFARQCFWAFENVRINCQIEMTAKLRKYYKRSKSIMRKRKEKLNADEKEDLIVMLDYNKALRKAYYLKDQFYLLLDETDRKMAEMRLLNWIRNAKESGLKEFRECVTIYRNWFNEILNYYTSRYVNAVAEGFNNKIKVIKRV